MRSQNEVLDNLMILALLSLCPQNSVLEFSFGFLSLTFHFQPPPIPYFIVSTLCSLFLLGILIH